MAKRVERDMWAEAYAQQRQQHKVLNEPKCVTNAVVGAAFDKAEVNNNAFVVSLTVFQNQIKLASLKVVDVGVDEAEIAKLWSVRRHGNAEQHSVART